jgi:hypothetical protein
MGMKNYIQKMAAALPLERTAFADWTFENLVGGGDLPAFHHLFVEKICLGGTGGFKEGPENVFIHKSLSLRF